jgi:hypothetical protein
MKKHESDTLEKFALAFSVLGVGRDLLLSSGLFGKLTGPQVAKESSSTKSQQMAQGWRRQLEAIDQQCSEKQKELEAGGKFDFSVQSGPDGITYQSVTMHRHFAEKSIFLRRLGLRWARSVSKAALDLQAQSLIIRYISVEDAARKAQVMPGFLVMAFDQYSKRGDR